MDLTCIKREVSDGDQLFTNTLWHLDLPTWTTLNYISLCQSQALSLLIMMAFLPGWVVSPLHAKLHSLPKKGMYFIFSCFVFCCTFLYIFCLLTQVKHLPPRTFICPYWMMLIFCKTSLSLERKWSCMRQCTFVTFSRKKKDQGKNGMNFWRQWIYLMDVLWWYILSQQVSCLKAAHFLHLRSAAYSIFAGHIFCSKWLQAGYVFQFHHRTRIIGTSYSLTQTNKSRKFII